MQSIGRLSIRIVSDFAFRMWFAFFKAVIRSVTSTHLQNERGKMYYIAKHMNNNGTNAFAVGSIVLCEHLHGHTVLWLATFEYPTICKVCVSQRKHNAYEKLCLILKLLEWLSFVAAS